MLNLLAPLGDHFIVFNLFRYITFRSGAACLTALFIAFLLGPMVIRWLNSVQRGGQPGTITDIAIWAVPFGIVGGRLYHVISDHQLYFSPGGSGLAGALKIWDGGLGIWGAVALGALGAWIGAKRQGVALMQVADAIAPGIALVLLVIGVNLLADGLRDVADPTRGGAH